MYMICIHRYTYTVNGYDVHVDKCICVYACQQYRRKILARVKAFDRHSNMADICDILGFP